MKKRIFAFIMSARLVFALLPFGAKAADGTAYWDPVEKTAKVSPRRAVPIEESTTGRLSRGWYTVTGEVANSGDIEISEEVNLILSEGSKLTLANSIKIKDGGSLTVWTETEAGTGIIESNSYNKIFRVDGGSLTVMGGVVRNTGTTGVIDIYRGSFTANGGTFEVAETGRATRAAVEAFLSTTMPVDITINRGVFIGGEDSTGAGLRLDSGYGEMQPMKVTINGGSFSGRSGFSMNSGAKEYFTVNINSGAFKGIGGSAADLKSCKRNISGGSFESIPKPDSKGYGVKSEYSDLTVTGGEFKGENGLKVQGCEIVINDGAFISNATDSDGAGVRLETGCNLTVRRGSFTGVSSGLEVDGNATADIKGGSFKATGSPGHGMTVEASGGTATVTVEGGSFKGSPDGGDGIQVQKGADVTIEKATVRAGNPGKAVNLMGGRADIKDNSIDVEGLNIEANPADGGTVERIIHAAEGDSAKVELIATRNSGYDFVRWLYKGAEIGKEAKYTIDPWNQDTEWTPPTALLMSASPDFIADFEPTTYSVSKDEGDNGFFELSSLSPKYGEKVTITPKPSTGYKVSRVKVVADGGDTVPTEESGGVYSFTQPADNVTVTVSFEKENYPVTANKSGEGELKDLPTAAFYGDRVTFADGSEHGIDKITVRTASGSEVTLTDNGDGSYSFVMPADAVEIEVSFKTPDPSLEPSPQPSASPKPGEPAPSPSRGGGAASTDRVSHDTGDDFNPLLWITLLILSAAILIALAVLSKRKKK